MHKRIAAKVKHHSKKVLRYSRPWLKARARKAVVALVSRRLAITALLAVLALEMAVLGVGLSRRLEFSYERAMEVSRAELAVIEARTMQQAGTGSAVINAGQATSEENDPAADDADAPPPLRPRDIDTILAQEGAEDDVPDVTEDDDDAATADESPNAAAVVREDEETPAEGDEKTEEDNNAPAPTPLSADDKRKVDNCIRRGVTAMTAGDMREAVLQLEQARAVAPDHPAMLYYLGMAYDKLQNPEKARPFYTQVFRMRSNAGKYFRRASRRLTYGFSQASAMRGKLAFGPPQVQRSYDEETGERVDMLLPVLLAPGEEVNPADVFIKIDFFDLVNGHKIRPSRLASPKLSWQNEKPSWQDWEENLLITYSMPNLTQEEIAAYGELKYYGYTAMLYYKEEPMDCISSPASLMLYELRFSRGSARSAPAGNGLLPDDGLDSSYEEALPVSDFLNTLSEPGS